PLSCSSFTRARSAASICSYEVTSAITRGSSPSAKFSLPPAGLPLLLRPRGEDLVHGVGQASIPLLRRAEQLRLQFSLNKRANEFGACFHAATVGHSQGWQQRTLVPI